MDRWLQRVFGKLVRRGTLRISTGPGRSFEVGDGTGEPVVVAFKSRFALLSIMANPELKLGESYMDGSMRMERGSIATSSILFSRRRRTSRRLRSAS